MRKVQARCGALAGPLAVLRRLCRLSQPYIGQGAVGGVPTRMLASRHCCVPVSSTMAISVVWPSSSVVKSAVTVCAASGCNHSQRSRLKSARAIQLLAAGGSARVQR